MPDLEAPSYQAESLLESFVSDWTARSMSLTMLPYGSSYHIMKIHAIRYFSNEFRVQEKELSFGDIPIIRERGELYWADDLRSDYLEESRVSLALVVDYSKTFPCFTVVLLTDIFLAPPEPKTIPIDCRFSPIRVFIGIIDDVVQHVCERWERVLEVLDSGLSVKVGGRLMSGGYLRVWTTG